MLPLFILAIENDDDRQFVADIYTRYSRRCIEKRKRFCMIMTAPRKRSTRQCCGSSGISIG